MVDTFLLQVLGVGTILVLLAFFLSEFLDWTKLYKARESAKSPVSFGYFNHNGPHTWKNHFPDCLGKCQSPVNIATENVVEVNFKDGLAWSGYSRQPQWMTMANDGTTAILKACWPGISSPYLSGGPLEFQYVFHNMLFHWGPSNNEGSEHMFNYMSFPMELHMLHCKQGYSNPLEVLLSGAKDGIVILALFFQITVVDNPYLDHIVNNLWKIEEPMSTTDIPAFPLDWIYAPFKRNFYTYMGSLTRPPCSEVVTWIIQPDPIAISSDQMKQFRRLKSADGPLLCNSRPVQHLNNRHVYYYY